MQIGFSAPIAGDLARPDVLARLAAEGEAMGFGYTTLSDHVVIPTNISARYPYSETGEFPQGSRGARLEQLTALAFIAAKTTRLRLLTSVMVVPHRPAVLTAKMLATIDVLSDGRLDLGIGAGWLEEEFVAIGTPPFAERGRVTDEYLEAFQELWTSEQPRFSGRHVRFADISFAPKPLQKPHPPIWVGGESPAALRRTARLGDCWYPIGTNPRHLLDTLPRLSAGIDRLRRMVTEAGRDASRVSVAFRSARHGTALSGKADDGERKLLSGSPADLAADLRALRGLGVTSVDFTFPGNTAEQVLAAMRSFADDVMARV